MNSTNKLVEVSSMINCHNLCTGGETKRPTKCTFWKLQLFPFSYLNRRYQRFTHVTMNVRHKLVKVASIIIHQSLCTGGGWVKRFFSIHHVWCDGSKSSLDFCVNHENVVDSFIYPNSFHIPDSKGPHSNKGYSRQVTMGRTMAGDLYFTFICTAPRQMHLLHPFSLHTPLYSTYVVRCKTTP